ncbi:hypothetical protein CMI37_11035 [Candidatus Pacearchaeota archaeon]|nr:hypothetical protein [Candidatus Pacearchaeota archaeon]
MAVPTLTPSSQTSKVILPVTGTHSEVTLAKLPFGYYASGGNLHSVNFVSGAVEQVAYTYRKLGGDVLDIELKAQNVYAAYEEAVLEYSYLINTHQAKNVLDTLLGRTTGSFDHQGQITSGDTLSGSNIALTFPRFQFGYAKRVGDATSTEVGLGGQQSIYSASFSTTVGQQDYDLQTIISSSAANDNNIGYPYYNKIGNKRVTVRKVFYKTPHAMWRFYGYYGGLNTVGNLHQYGQFADDANFELVPAWQNKLQAMAFEDNLWTRTSHYSYEIKNNKLRLFPDITITHPEDMWVEFTVDEDPWVPSTDFKDSTEGVNNLNTLPFENLPYRNINAIGKQWIRRFALALTKEVLGQVRGKFGAIPIPGESVTLNYADLLSQAKEEQEKLREELKTILDEMVYNKLAEQEATLTENVNKVNATIPAGIFVG